MADGAARRGVERTGGPRPSVVVYADSGVSLIVMMLPAAAALLILMIGVLSGLRTGENVLWAVIPTGVVGAALFGMVRIYRRRRDRPAVIIDEHGVTCLLGGTGRWGPLPWDQIAGLRPGGSNGNPWVTLYVRDPELLVASAGPVSRLAMRVNGWFLHSPACIAAGMLPLRPEALIAEIRALAPPGWPRRVPARLPVGAEPGASAVVVDTRDGSTAVTLFGLRVALVPLGVGSPLVWLPVGGLVLAGANLAAAGPDRYGIIGVLLTTAAGIAAVLFPWMGVQYLWWAATSRFRRRPVLVLDERGIHHRRPFTRSWSLPWEGIAGVGRARVRGTTVAELRAPGGRPARRVPMRSLPVSFDQLLVAVETAAPARWRRSA